MHSQHGASVKVSWCGFAASLSGVGSHRARGPALRAGQTGEDMERAIESLSVQHEATELVQADVEEVRPLVALAEHGCCR